MSEVFAGVGAFKSMLDMARALKDMDSAVSRAEIVINLQEKILAGQAAYSDLLQSKGELEKEVARAKDWEAEKQRYELVALHDGAFAYRVKDAQRGVEPEHYLCTNCYADGKKSILQGMTTTYQGHILTCARCGTRVTKEFSYPG